MDTITLNDLDQRLSKSFRDFIEEDTSTNLTTSTGIFILSTALNQWDRGRDDFFNDWWAFILDGANAEEDRNVSDYGSTLARLTLRGAAWSSTTAAVTFRLYRISRTKKRDAINEAFREIYPTLHKQLDDRTLITGNYLPNAHFEDQATAGTPDNYSYTDLAGAGTGAGGAAETIIIRGGAKAIKVTTTGANGYMCIKSSDYPQLLDLMGKTIDFKCWVYPKTAADAYLRIYTIQADGTTQTLPSTVSYVTSATKYQLAELKSQKLNDDLTGIEFRFCVKTSGDYAIFDNARILADNKEILLPEVFQDGDISQVHYQTSQFADYPCDDLKPTKWERIFDSGVISDGSKKYLRFNSWYPEGRLIRLLGTTPFTALTTQTSSIAIDQQKVPLLIAYAKYKLFEGEAANASADDKSRYEVETAKAYREYLILSQTHRMKRPTPTMKLPVY